MEGFSTHKGGCIIHSNSTDAKTEHLITPQNRDSWLSLLQAAEIRDYAPIIDIADQVADGGIHDVVYHRRCRSLFTLKRDLETLKRRADNTTSDSGPDSKRTHRRSSSESRVYNTDCIFCDKIKYQKGSKTRERLVKASQLRVDHRLRQCAVERSDEKLLAVTSRDIVAAEAHYHASCYKLYTKAVKGEEAESTVVHEIDDDSRSESDSYHDLFHYIRTDIVPNKLIVPIVMLAAKVESILLSKGLESIVKSGKKNLKRRLESEFGNSLHFVSGEGGKLLVVPDSVGLDNVVLENQKLQKEVKLWKGKSSDMNKMIDRVSQHIRSDIKDNAREAPWPYHPSDITELVSVPVDLERFLVGLLTGETDINRKSQRVNLLTQSFSQDLIYAVTGGQQKTPKHLLLPYAVKTLTGNVEIIKTLNRLGHGISYSQLEENDTALCLQKLAASMNQKLFLPVTVQPNVFTNLGWDNIDRLEETLTGKGTTHRVNGIAVQGKVYGPQLPTAGLPRIEKHKQRTVSTERPEIPTYIAGNRIGPQPLKTAKIDIGPTKTMASAKNLIWVLARLVDTEQHTIPSWTGFNISTRDLVPISEDVISYLPTINAPATELTTVFEILNQSELIRKELQLTTIVVVMDQALYAKATEIAWKHKSRYENILLRMGVFHTICNALGTIGKRFQDAGLRDLCLESGIVAEGSISRVLDGKMYNRAVRIHKYIYEALMRLAWNGFLEWLAEKQSVKIPRIDSFMDQVKTVSDDLNQKSIEDLLDCPLFCEMQQLWNAYLDHLRTGNGELSAFWMSYIDIVEHVLLGLLRSSREGNWRLHLHAIRAMIPWSFAYDKVNYARYLSAYYAQMTNLQEEHPYVYEAFEDGRFSVQMSNSNHFGRIPMDQAVETTVNKDTQTPGGTTKFSLQSGAVKRYYMTAEHRSAFLCQLRDMIQGNTGNYSHTDLNTSRIRKDKEHVESVESLLEGWVNPFAANQDLISISTARAPPQDITNDLMNAHCIGERCYETFKEERLEQDPPKTNFHDKMKLNKLKTFSDMCKKKSVKSSGRTIILKADRSLFGRIIVTSQVRNLEMKDVLCHPLGPLPWSLATPEGMLRKTNKAALAARLQKNVKFADQLPDNSSTVVDGMNLVQRTKGDQSTFGQIASTILEMALREGNKSMRIDVVFDTYTDMSIKNSERLVRGEERNNQLQNITASQLVTNWRNFLRQINNKTSLIEFIVNEWKKTEYTVMLQGKVLYATSNCKCFRITAEGSEEVAELECSQEEADGRLLLHAAHSAQNGYPNIVICSEDTDVFILCLACHQSINARLFQKCGTKARTRVLDIARIGASISKDVCSALIGMHAYTGCDSVSAFAGKGKARALELITNSLETQNIFTELGQEWHLSEDLQVKLEAFTCQLYASKASVTCINDLRYYMFCEKKGDIESHQLPPCQDCLLQHMKRANYQAAIWRRCLEQNPKVPNPDGHGWKLERIENTHQLSVVWMQGQPAPESVLDLMACSCIRKCEQPECCCIVNGLHCTDMCRLKDCSNQVPPDLPDSTDTQDDLDDVNEDDED